MIKSGQPRQNEVWGVSFDSPAAHVASATVRSDSSISQHSARLSHIPAAALVPRIGERVRVDLVIPPHPRGTGRSWPPEAVYDKEGCGRFPLMLAWPFVDNDEVWKWAFQDENHQLTPYAALAAGVREAIPASAETDDNRNVTFVIPNHWHELKQQNLLDALHFEGVSARLLWRPIAAALAWCQRMSLQGNDDARARNNKLLVLYAGLESFELTLLDLVDRHHNGFPFILPGRKRPARNGHFVVGCGYSSVLQHLSRCSYEFNPVMGLGQLWERMWATPWLLNLLSAATSERFAITSRPDIANLRGESELQNLVACRHSGNWSDLIRWCQQWSRQLKDEQIAGAVIVGPLASALGPEGEPLADQLLGNMGCQHVVPFIEGRDAPYGLLAQGAALYSARLRAKLPTYLDTLPRLQTVITRAGEPCWIDLLKDDQQFVEGGEIWRRPENLDGLALAKGSHDLKLAVSHEDFNNVREVIAPLPRAVTERESVSIAVAIEPAQGNARLEVFPNRPEVFDKRRVVFDWKRMTELPLTREQYVDGLPRIYPNVLPRLSSPSRWQLTKTLVSSCTRQLTTGAATDNLIWSLQNVKQSLQQKDASYYPQDATAIGSEGQPINDPQVLVHFVEQCLEYLRGDAGRLNQHLIRAVAYTSTSHEPLLEYLHSELLHDGQSSGQDVVTACGWCFRDPTHIASFARILESRIRASHTNAQVWWKAFSEMLRYRTNATRDISNDQAEVFTSLALRTFEFERQRRSGKLLFRYVSLVIVYLLRRRAYEDAYLDPLCPLAESVKNAFRQAQADVKAGRLRLLGGAVNMAEQLQLMIDYIDRRGSGQLLLDV